MRIQACEWVNGYYVGILDADEEIDSPPVSNTSNHAVLSHNPLSAPCLSDNGSMHINSNSRYATWRSGDVIIIDSNGHATRQYDGALQEHTFVLSNQCNSNCIMCPSSEVWRRKGKALPLDVHSEIAMRIPQNLRHITITGGEPFLAGAAVFPFFSILKHRFDRTDFQLLTNGRALALKSYADQLSVALPQSTLIGIPIHSADERLHDTITQVIGSFQQTCLGVERMLTRGLAVELRVVVSRYNASTLIQTANLIAERFPTTWSVKFMGMEMLGSAAVHASDLWIPYEKAFKSARPAIERLITAGIDVALYNFPLCAVSPEFWTLCRRSISPGKVRYLDECDECSVRDACGGLFAGSRRFVEVSRI